jgi:hypothetical protein
VLDSNDSAVRSISQEVGSDIAGRRDLAGLTGALVLDDRNRGFDGCLSAEKTICQLVNGETNELKVLATGTNLPALSLRAFSAFKLPLKFVVS